MNQIRLTEFCFGTAGRIWVCIFFYAAASAGLLQLVVLPYLLTGLHGGNGLLAGGDWVGFHRFAVALADKVSQQGWGAWELRTENQAPAGIAAGFYAIFTPHPWVLIPINAAIHATTGVLLIRIVQPFVPNLRYALLCVLPFIVFPSALTLYAQIHKDGTFFLGVFLCLYAWILLSRIDTWSGRHVRVLVPVFYAFTGCFFIWVMRPYAVKVIQGVGCLVVAVLLVSFFIRVLRRQMPAWKALVAVLIAVTLLVSLGLFKDNSAGGDVTLVKNSMLEAASQAEEDIGLEVTRGSFGSKVRNVLLELRWKKTEWLPGSLDNAFLTLAIVRYGYAGSKGGSNIDTDLMLHSAPEFLLYLPRAVQIGFTAPFPVNWLAQGSSQTSGAMRTISAMEMIIVYSALAFLPYSLWLWRRKIEIWIIFIFCSTLLLLYTYITPNIGSLYRSRYGYLLMFVALGFAGAVSVWQRVAGRVLVQKTSV